MSQEKIDKRKAEKANRKKQLAKKKQKRIINILFILKPKVLTRGETPVINP